MMRWRGQWPLWLAAVIATGSMTLTAMAAEALKPDIKAGKADYQKFCLSCHGPSGRGDGPLGASLSVKVPDFTDTKLMRTLKDEDIFKAIKEGGVAVGKSPLMPPWSGTIGDQEIRSLVGYIRTLANPEKK